VNAHFLNGPLRGIWLSLVLLVFASLRAGGGETKRVLLLHSFGPELAPYNAVSRSFHAELARHPGAPVDFHEAASLLTTNGTFVAVEGRLPARSVIPFRQPSFWETHRWWIIGILLFCALQAALIISLLISRAKRRQGEAMATLIASLSSKFINLPAGEVDKAIQDAQRRVCAGLGLDVSSLWQWSSEDSDKLVMTHLYRRLPGPATPERLNAREYFPWALQQFKAGKIVALSLNNVPAEAAGDLEAWRHFGLKTMLNLPLTVGGGQPIGLIAFNDLKAERKWTDLLVQPLQLAAQIFANALARKQADEVLRESEARLSLAVDAAGVGLWSLRLETGRFWLTAKTRELLSVGANEEVTFERFLSVVHPEDRAQVRQAVQGMVHSRKEGRVEYRILRPEGAIRWMASRGRVQCNATGLPDHLTGVTGDITPRKDAEHQLQRQREELAHVARVSVMGELAASVAHELNQPLGAILGNAEAAELFLEQDPPALGEVRAILADIRKDDERAGEVIRRMRGLLRKGERERQPLQINLLVEDAFRLVAANAALRSTTLRAELRPDLPEVQGDRIQLQQVVLNLVMNAMEAMAGQSAETRRLTVRTRGTVNGGITIEVADSGPGIAGNSLPRIFEPFFTTKQDGIGMGLSISRKIVEAHDGRIWAENNPAGGAVFRVTLPAITPGTRA
jgi:PAS domain S-box-containing protein